MLDHNAWLRPVAALLLILAVTLVFAREDPPRFIDKAGVQTDLPRQIGAWQGEQILFCQNREHQEVFMRSAVEGETCPVCGGPLAGGSLTERSILPGDTVIVKYQYRRESGPELVVSIVLSGHDRSSLHRPQMCLVGNGNEIVESNVLPVPRTGKTPLKIMVLDLLTHRMGPSGQPIQNASFFAYWLAGPGHTTPYHLQRMFWMAAERILYNHSTRWAYVAVSGPRDTVGGNHVRALTEFVNALYPHVMISNPGHRDKP